jgi:hypothetical protein
VAPEDTPVSTEKQKRTTKQRKIAYCIQQTLAKADAMEADVSTELDSSGAPEKMQQDSSIETSMEVDKSAMDKSEADTLQPQASGNYNF